MQPIGVRKHEIAREHDLGDGGLETVYSWHLEAPYLDCRRARATGHRSATNRARRRRPSIPGRRQQRRLRPHCGGRKRSRRTGCSSLQRQLLCIVAEASQAERSGSCPGRIVLVLAYGVQDGVSRTHKGFPDGASTPMVSKQDRQR